MDIYQQLKDTLEAIKQMGAPTAINIVMASVTSHNTDLVWTAFVGGHMIGPKDLPEAVREAAAVYFKEESKAGKIAWLRAEADALEAQL